MDQILLRTTPTVDLMNILSNADDNKTNQIIYEIACRLYVPGTDITFEDLLSKLGYKEEVVEGPVLTLTRSTITK